MFRGRAALEPAEDQARFTSGDTQQSVLSQCQGAAATGTIDVRDMGMWHGEGLQGAATRRALVLAWMGRTAVAEDLMPSRTGWLFRWTC